LVEVKKTQYTEGVAADKTFLEYQAYHESYPCVGFFCHRAGSAKYGGLVYRHAKAEASGSYTARDLQLAVANWLAAREDDPTMNGLNIPIAHQRAVLSKWREDEFFAEARSCKLTVRQTAALYVIKNCEIQKDRASGRLWWGWGEANPFSTAVRFVEPIAVSVTLNEENEVEEVLRRSLSPETGAEFLVPGTILFAISTSPVSFVKDASHLLSCVPSFYETCDPSETGRKRAIELRKTLMIEQ